MRGWIQEYPDMLAFGDHCVGPDRLLLRDGQRAWSVVGRGKSELIAYGTGLLDSFAVDASDAWVSYLHKETWHVIQMTSPCDGLAAGAKRETKNSKFPKGVQPLRDGRALALQTDKGMERLLGLYDARADTFTALLEHPVYHVSSHGLTAARSASGAVILIDRDGTTRFRRELGSSIKGLALVTGDGRPFVYVMGAERRTLLSGSDGSVVWTVEGAGLSYRGTSAGRIWESDEQSGDVIGRDVDTGDVVERWPAGVHKNTMWRFTEWQGRIVELAEPLNQLRIREPGTGALLQFLDMPEPFGVWGYYAPLEFGRHLVMPVAAYREGYKGSVYGLLFLSVDEAEPDAVVVEPRPPHRIEKIAGARGGHGYRVAMRCSAADDLLRMGLVLVKQIACEKGRSPMKRGERSFDGTIEFAFDPDALPADALERVQRWVGLWTAELKMLVSAPGGKPINVKLVPYAPDMLEGQ